MSLHLGDLAVAQVVHDLRNELVVAQRCAEELASLMPAGQAGRELDELRTCTERASLLARELLVAARPRRAARHPIDLNNVINQSAARLSSAMGRGVRPQLRLCDGPLFVHAEMMELERILLNLVLNACEAMGGDGVVTIQTESVSDPGQGIRLKSAPPYARLTVSDTGGGLPEEMTSRVFEPFFTTTPGGTGLGLSSVGFTVRQLRGTVALTSERGHGTAVMVILPLSPHPSR